MTTLDASRQDIRHMYPAFFPDGRHFMYHVDSAQREYTGIYVGPLDSKATKRGLDIGRRAVTVNGDAHTFEAEVPVALFDVHVGRHVPGLLPGMYHYDVTADEQRFLVNTLVVTHPAPPITVALNWTAGLKR